MRRGRKWLRGAALVASLAVLMLAVCVERASRLELGTLTPVPSPLVLDRQDRLLWLGENPRGQRVIWLPAEPLPKMVAAAFLAAEDARFYEHRGLDLKALARAVWSNLRAGRVVSGASTITQQLARLACPAPRTYYHKLVETVRSFRIEASLTKEEILRAYLNAVPQGNNLVGVETAARLYFGKPAAQLTPPEAAVLAALAKAPGTLNPRGTQRQRLLSRRDWVLQRLEALGRLSREESLAARQTPLRVRPGSLFPLEAPHFVHLAQALAGEGGSGVIRTSLDLSLQRRAQAVVRSHRSRLQIVGVSQAAAVILKNRSMEVAALVGSFHYGPRDQGFNNGATARRSPGSTLKPFLYAQALDQGFNPAQILEDVDSRYRTPRGEFVPANYDRVAHGPIAMREALGNSLNLAAVYLLNQVGPPAFSELLSRLRLINHPERGPEHYGLGLVVGNPEVSLLELAAAFACLANGGEYRPVKILKNLQGGGPDQVSPPHPEPVPSRGEGKGKTTDSGHHGDAMFRPAADSITAEEGAERIFSPQAASIVSDILADPLARARTFAGSQAMNPPFPLAIKTGTSTKYRDCWAVGYTREYTLAVWAGNFNGRPTAKMSGAAAAAPILAELAALVVAADQAPGFAPAPGVERLEVCAFSGMRPGPGCRHRRQELFIAGTLPEGLCTYHQPQAPWHHMPTRFAGWLHDRFQQQGPGRFRLAGFEADLERLFGEADTSAGSKLGDTPHPGPLPLRGEGRKRNIPLRRASSPGQNSSVAEGSLGRQGGKPSLGVNETVYLHTTLFPARPARKEPLISIAAPLPGDRFLLPPGQSSLGLTLKAACRAPFPQVTWFVDGREYAATGPPYEMPVQLGRGRHRLTVTGPDGLGDTVEIAVE